MLQLRAVGVAAVPPLLQILNDPTQAPTHPAALHAVTEIGSPSVPPLLAALDAPNDGLRASAASALGYLRSADAEPYLWQPALSDPSAAVRSAARQALAKILKVPVARLESLESAQVATRLVKASREFSRSVWKRPHGIRSASSWSTCKRQTLLPLSSD